MNVLTPEYFDSLSSLIINFLTFITSIATLLLTWLMYQAALRALKTWREQDNHGLLLEAISFHKKAISVIRTIKSEYPNVLTEQEIEEINSENPSESRRSLYLIKGAQKKINEFRIELDLLEKITQKLILAFQPNTPIKEFYIDISKIFDDFQLDIQWFEYAVYSKNNCKKSFDEAVLQLRKKSNSFFSVNDVVNKKTNLLPDDVEAQTLQEDIRNYTELHNLALYECNEYLKRIYPRFDQENYYEKRLRDLEERIFEFSTSYSLTSA